MTALFSQGVRLVAIVSRSAAAELAAAAMQARPFDEKMEKELRTIVAGFIRRPTEDDTPMS
jgi:hypothetical protein